MTRADDVQAAALGRVQYLEAERERLMNLAVDLADEKLTLGLRMANVEQENQRLSDIELAMSLRISNLTRVVDAAREVTRCSIGTGPRCRNGDCHIRLADALAANDAAHAEGGVEK